MVVCCHMHPSCSRGRRPEEPQAQSHQSPRTTPSPGLPLSFPAPGEPLTHLCPQGGAGTKAPGVWRPASTQASSPCASAASACPSPQPWLAEGRLGTMSGHPAPSAPWWQRVLTGFLWLSRLLCGSCAETRLPALRTRQSKPQCTSVLGKWGAVPVPQVGWAGRRRQGLVFTQVGRPGPGGCRSPPWNERLPPPGAPRLLPSAPPALGVVGGKPREAWSPSPVD